MSREAPGERIGLAIAAIGLGASRLSTLEPFLVPWQPRQLELEVTTGVGIVFGLLAAVSLGAVARTFEGRPRWLLFIAALSRAAGGALATWWALEQFVPGPWSEPGPTWWWIRPLLAVDIATFAGCALSLSAALAGIVPLPSIKRLAWLGAGLTGATSLLCAHADFGDPSAASLSLGRIIETSVDLVLMVNLFGTWRWLRPRRG